jgi:uncharacterized protein YqhQ
LVKEHHQDKLISESDVFFYALVLPPLIIFNLVPFLTIWGMSFFGISFGAVWDAVIAALLGFCLQIIALAAVGIDQSIKHGRQFHGAEHKVVNAHRGVRVAFLLENVKRQSVLCTDCGSTSYGLFYASYFAIAAVANAFLALDSLRAFGMMFLISLVAIPVALAMAWLLSYAFIAIAGVISIILFWWKIDDITTEDIVFKIVYFLPRRMQAVLTTEPDDEQLQMAYDAALALLCKVFGVQKIQTGAFMGNIFSGDADVSLSNGGTYSGSMKDYIFEGNGVCTLADGRKIAGTWENGIPQDCEFTGFAAGETVEFTFNGNDVKIDFAEGEARCAINDLYGRDFEREIPR